MSTAGDKILRKANPLEIEIVSNDSHTREAGFMHIKMMSIHFRLVNTLLILKISELMDQRGVCKTKTARKIETLEQFEFKLVLNATIARPFFPKMETLMSQHF